MYTLDLCQKVEGECRYVTININASEHTSDGIIRYDLLLVIVDVLMCSYLHRYSITDQWQI